MGYGYSMPEWLYNIQTTEAVKLDTEEQDRFFSSAEYKLLLDDVRATLARDHSKALEGAYNQKTNPDDMRAILSRVAIGSKYIPDMSSRRFRQTIDKLYAEFFDFGFLTSFILDDTTEEINVDAWNDIEIVRGGRYWKLKEHFVSPQAAADMAKRLARIGGRVADSATPIVDSDISKGVRINVQLPPVVDDEAGAVFSIRKQRRHTITREELLRTGTATVDELDCIQLMASYGVSIGFAGATGSGKTTDLNFFAYNLPIERRLYTIEEGSRELNLLRYGPNGEVISRVVSVRTRPNEGKALQDVTSTVLVKAALRQDPDLIMPSEMRGREAYDVQEAGRTGHQIMTSFHADSARTAYDRYLTMCESAKSGFSTDQLRIFCYQSLPVMCYKETLKDGRRKFIEIVEAVEYPTGIIVQPIFRFVITENVKDASGRITQVNGENRRVNYVSNALAYKMFSRGAPLEEIRRFARPDYSPTLHHDTNDPPTKKPKSQGRAATA